MILLVLSGPGLPVTMMVSGHDAGGVTATTSSAMLGCPPAGIAAAATGWHLLVPKTKKLLTCTPPVNEPMSTVCSEPFSTELPPTESGASFDAVTAPAASCAWPTDP